MARKSEDGEHERSKHRSVWRRGAGIGCYVNPDLSYEKGGSLGTLCQDGRRRKGNEKIIYRRSIGIRETHGRVGSAGLIRGSDSGEK